MNKLRTMNGSLFYAANHLIEAGKYMSNVEEFRPYAVKLVEAADVLASLIKPEPEKVSDEKMKSVLDEIMNFGAPHIEVEEHGGN